MGMIQRYRPGGYDPGISGHNLAEQIDTDTGTLTRYDRQGNVIESRPLTADEIAALTPPPVVKTADQRLADAVSALATLDTLAAPVLPVDVLDVLTDLRTALED